MNDSAEPVSRPRLLGERAARHDLGDIGRTKLWELIKNREIEVVRIGRRTLVTSKSIDEFIARQGDEHRTQP